MIAALARTARRQQRHLDALVRNERIRTLALARVNIGEIQTVVDRSEIYIRRIAGWRLK